MTDEIELTFHGAAQTVTGSCMEVRWQGRRMLIDCGLFQGSRTLETLNREPFAFAADPAHKAFHPDPDGPARLDHIICESTYGDRDRAEITIDERRRLLEAEIKAARTRGGNLVIPVFAVERTQELLLDVASLINSGQLPYTPLFIDSPLASRATGVFARHGRELEDMGSGEIFHHSAFHYVESAAESMRLNTLSGAIIMAASGMCEAGRIRHHLLHNLPRRESTVLFVGYQAQGSLGRTILEGAGRVRISGRDVAARAQIRRIDSYSAHADRSDILAWIAARQPIGGSIFLTHGEADAIESLRRELQGKDAAASIVTPRIGERYALGHAAAAKRTATGRIEAQQAVGRDWQNDYADFSVNLKRELRKIRDDAQRKEALDRMRRILREYGAFRREHGSGT